MKTYKIHKTPFVLNKFYFYTELFHELGFLLECLTTKYIAGRS